MGKRMHTLTNSSRLTNPGKMSLPGIHSTAVIQGAFFLTGNDRCTLQHGDRIPC